MSATSYGQQLSTPGLGDRTVQSSTTDGGQTGLSHERRPSNVKQLCADCASDAEHCQKAGTNKALNEPGSNNSSISVTTGPSRGYHFFKNKIMLLQ